MRISRPCYDKPHRCPGWAGGGWLYGKIDHCPGKTGGMWSIYDKRMWRWRFNRHPECGVIVLPYIVRWFDWRHWWMNPMELASRVRYRFDIAVRRIRKAWPS